MRQMDSPAIQRWSTRGVAPARRLDVYAEALTSAVDPMRVTSGQAASFHAEVASASLGPLTVIRAAAGAHHCVRADEDIARSGERCFHLIINTASSWGLTHRGPVRLRAGDAVLLDSEIGHRIELPEFQITHLKLSESWLRQWVSSPGLLAGRVLPHDVGWGRALSAFVAQLSPEFVARAPLSARVMSDQIGVLLALVTDELSGTARPPATRESVLRERIMDCIAQRCTEHELGVGDVAATLGLSVRSLQRNLASFGESFGSALIAARVEVALRMLESPLFDRLTTAEIGRRAGFSDASHFARVVLLRCGRTPLRIRRDRGLPSGD